MFHAILGDREHVFAGSATRNFVHVSIRRLFPASDGLEVAGLSMFQDDPPRAGLLQSGALDRVDSPVAEQDGLMDGWDGHGWPIR